MHDRRCRFHGDDRARGCDSSGDETIGQIIAELSEVFAFARTRWTKYAEEVHPDLKGVGMMVLQTILRKGPITATALSQLLDMDKAMMSRQVSRLRELDLVTSEPSEEDRRVTLLMASDAARTTLDKLHAQTSHDYHEKLADWSDEELTDFLSALQRFNGDAGAREAG